MSKVHATLSHSELACKSCEIDTLRSVSAHHVSHLRSHWSRRGHMSRGTYNVRQIVRKKANGKKLKETDTDKFPSEKKLSRKFFFRISRRIWGFCRDLSSSLVGKMRQVTRDAISDLCTDAVRHKYPVARPDSQTVRRSDDRTVSRRETLPLRVVTHAVALKIV